MKWLKQNLILLAVAVFFIVPLYSVDAQTLGCVSNPNGQYCSYQTNYVPMINIPGVTAGGGVGSFSSYANVLYGFAIVAAALLAVIRLVIAGAKYMMSDVVTSKGQAIADIQGSLLGLLIIIAAVVVLQTINPNLTTIGLGLHQQGAISGSNIGQLITFGPAAQPQPNPGDWQQQLGNAVQDCTLDPTTDWVCDTVGSCACVPKTPTASNMLHNYICINNTTLDCSACSAGGCTCVCN